MKRNTVRILLVLLMMLSLCFLCAACGGDGGNTESTGNTASTGSTGSTESSTAPTQDDPTESTGGDVPEPSDDDYSMYVGIWQRDTDEQFDFIDINAEGNWWFYSDGILIADGYFWYVPEENVTYIYTYEDSEIDYGHVVLDDDRLDISTLGSFHYLTLSTSEFEGVWYLDEDLSADAFIEIDGAGYWVYYQRTSDDPEGTMTDCGTLFFSMEQADLYYANPVFHDGSYLVLNFDTGILVWGDEGAFYRMEDLP